MKEVIQKAIKKGEPAIERRSRKEGIKMQITIKKIPIASFMDHEKIGQIIIEPLTHLPFCDMCNSFDCMHVKYAMSFKHVSLRDSVKLILTCLNDMAYFT